MIISKYVIVRNENILIEKLSINSHKKILVKCDNCGSEKEITYQSYNNSTNNNTTKYYCNNKECINIKRNLIIKEKYGVDNISQLNYIKEKKIKTCINNFGVKFPTQSKVVKEKTKKTNLEKYDSEWLTQSEYFKEKTKNTNLEKYGCEYSVQSDIIKEKTKQTNLEKYGTLCPLQSDTIKEKTKKTNLEKYGTDHPTKTDSVKNKMKKTNLEKYETEYPSKLDEIKLKVKERYIENYGVEHIMQLDEFKNKMKKTNIEKYETEFYSQSNFYKKIINNRNIIKLSNKYEINVLNIENNNIYCECNNCHNIFSASYQQLYNRYKYGVELCTICNPINSLSDRESQIQDIIRVCSNTELLFNNRTIISPYELDIYLPELKLAFEFNGLYWHSELYKDKKYHLNKTELCEKIGIELIHIYEDDLVYKQDIVRSMILNKLGKNEFKISALKCIIKEIDNKLTRQFLESNHIQGFVGSTIKIGLFYENELVSLMTFSKKTMGKKSTNNNEYKLLRFCNKLNTNVIGGASKMFKYFIKTYHPEEIITNTDRSFNQGKLYKNLGFEYFGKTEPNYYYIINGIRKHSKNIDKNKMKSEILDRKIYRIYDSGNLKFCWKK